MSKTIKILSLAGKLLGGVCAMNVIPGVSPEKGVLIFLIASILKDAVNRIGDYLDDGQQNNSFKP